MQEQKKKIFFKQLQTKSRNGSTEPPVIIVEPKDDVMMERYISEDIHMQCELSRSAGKVQWFKNGEEVEESGNIQLTKEGPYRRLTILHSTVEDGGEYVCETNGDSVFFQLIVTGKTEIGLHNERTDSIFDMYTSITFPLCTRASHTNYFPR